jgi:oligogalacturonide lyase
VFAPNADASVFVGASRSKAQPTVILLLRSTKREMTLCEHHDTHPKSVAPTFSPDSRRVYFQSDHEGKPALYSVNVELLVEPTAPTAG